MSMVSGVSVQVPAKENRGQMTEDRKQSAPCLLSSVFCALPSVSS